MRNDGLEEAQAGIKIATRNINNLRHADDTTLMAESEEELKILLIKVKEENDLGIWENGTETYILSCKKRITSLCSIQDTGCLGLVHGDDPER